MFCVESFEINQKEVEREHCQVVSISSLVYYNGAIQEWSTQQKWLYARMVGGVFEQKKKYPPSEYRTVFLLEILIPTVDQGVLDYALPLKKCQLFKQ